MNNCNDVVEITEVLPLALLDLIGKIMTAKKLHPERLGTLYTQYASVMKQIREEKDISIKELSALSGSSSDFLQAAESQNVDLTDTDLTSLHGVYWALATGEENPGDYKRLADERLATPTPEFGSPMTRIREEKQISIGELAEISGLPEDVLEAAEAGELEMTDKDSKEVQRVYWSLSALEATPGDYRRLLDEIATKASRD